MGELPVLPCASAVGDASPAEGSLGEQYAWMDGHRGDGRAIAVPAERATPEDEVRATVRADPNDVECLEVTAPQTESLTIIEMEPICDSQELGNKHFRRRNYEEASPHLLATARHGFKTSQARVASHFGLCSVWRRPPGGGRPALHRAARRAAPSRARRAHRGMCREDAPDGAHGGRDALPSLPHHPSLTIPPSPSLPHHREWSRQANRRSRQLRTVMCHVRQIQSETLPVGQRWGGVACGHCVSRSIRPWRWGLESCRKRKRSWVSCSVRSRRKVVST